MNELDYSVTEDTRSKLITFVITLRDINIDYIVLEGPLIILYVGMRLCHQGVENILFLNATGSSVLNDTTL
jgi:hypothetical protein